MKRMCWNVRLTIPFSRGIPFAIALAVTFGAGKHIFGCRRYAGRGRPRCSFLAPDISLCRCNTTALSTALCCASLDGRPGDWIFRAYPISRLAFALEPVLLPASIRESFRSQVLSQTRQFRHLKPDLYLSSTQDRCILQLRGVIWPRGRYFGFFSPPRRWIQHLSAALIYPPSITVALLSS